MSATPKDQTAQSVGVREGEVDVHWLCHDVPEKAEEVANRAGQDEKVPDHVRIGQGFPEVEDAAERVKSSAQHQPHRS